MSRERRGTSDRGGGGREGETERLRGAEKKVDETDCPQ